MSGQRLSAKLQYQFLWCKHFSLFVQVQKLFTVVSVGTLNRKMFFLKIVFFFRLNLSAQRFSASFSLRLSCSIANHMLKSLSCLPRMNFFQTSFILCFSCCVVVQVVRSSTLPEAETICFFFQKL